MREKFTAAATAIAIGATSLAAQAADTKVGGKMYFDLTDKTEKIGGGKTDNSGYGVDVPRFYLAVDSKFDDTWSANLTTDFNYSSTDGKSQLFVKKAYIQAAIAPLFKVRAGSADMPWIPLVEDQYGYRYVEQTTTDRQKFGNSADWGLHALGANEFVNYGLSVVNGAGYSNVSSRSKRMDIEGRVGVTPIAGLMVAAGVYNGALGNEKESVAAENTATRYNGMVSYVGNGLRVGGEYFQAKNFNKTAIITGPEDKATGYSTWASYDITDIIAVFARYDQTKPSKDLAPDTKLKYANAGVQYIAAKGVKIAAVYKYQKLDTGVDATEKKSNEFGVFGEFKF